MCAKYNRKRSCKCCVVSVEASIGFERVQFPLQHSYSSTRSIVLAAVREMQVFIPRRMGKGPKEAKEFIADVTGAGSISTNARVSTVSVLWG